jgi:serralysin
MAIRLTNRADIREFDVSTETILALGGNDVVVVTGGSGDDLFDFDRAKETGNKSATRDVITDFGHREDELDFSGMDARASTSGNNAFVWRGNDKTFGTSPKGELRYEKHNEAGTENDHTVVYGDVDSDLGSEFQIELEGIVSLTSTDFLL